MTVLYDIDAILQRRSFGDARIAACPRGLEILDALLLEYKSQPLAGRPAQLRFHAWKSGRRVVG